MEKCQICKKDAPEEDLENMHDVFKACKACAGMIKEKNPHLEKELVKVKSFHGFCSQCKTLLQDDEGWDRLRPLCMKCFNDFAEHFKGVHKQ